MEIEEFLIEEIVRRVLSAVTPGKIILFGSAARGRITRDSDIELLIVEPNPGDRHKESMKIDTALSGLGYPFDVIVKRFEANKNVFPMLPRSVISGHFFKKKSLTATSFHAYTV